MMGTNRSNNVAEDYKFGMISAITLDEELVSSSESLPRSLSDEDLPAGQKRFSGPEAEKEDLLKTVNRFLLNDEFPAEQKRFSALEPVKMDLLRNTNRFSSVSEGLDSKPCVKPRRKLSYDDGDDFLDYKADQRSDHCTFFLEEDCPVGSHSGNKVASEPQLSMETSLNDEDEFNSPIKLDEKRAPRRNYRGRRKATSSSDESAFGCSRTLASSSRSLEVGDVFGD